MALNSTNRFSSLSAEKGERDFLVEQKIEKERITLEESYGYLNDIDPDMSTNLQETCHKILDNNMDVFNGYIELEFVQAANRNSGILNESAQSKVNKKIIDKIAEQVTKVSDMAKDSIKNSGANFITVAESINSKDRDMYIKYIDAIFEHGLEGYRGIENFEFPIEESYEAIDDIVRVDELIENVNETVNKLNRSVDPINECMNPFTKYLAKFRGKSFECVKGLCKCHETWIPSNIDINMMEVYGKYNSSAIINSTNYAVYEVCNSIDKITDIITEAMNKCNDVEKANLLYNIESSTCQNIIEAYNKFKDMEIREIASFRAGIINCGKYAIKNSKGIHESAELQSINESNIIETSNLYVFDAFEE